MVYFYRIQPACILILNSYLQASAVLTLSLYNGLTHLKVIKDGINIFTPAAGVI